MKYEIKFQAIQPIKRESVILDIYAESYNEKLTKAYEISQKMLDDDETIWEVRWEDINIGQGHYISDWDRYFKAMGIIETENLKEESNEL
jgi:hypothetical protein